MQLTYCCWLQRYDDGVQELTNIDFSKVVIREMLMKNVRTRPKMKWLVMDMTDTKVFTQTVINAGHGKSICETKFASTILKETSTAAFINMC